MPLTVTNAVLDGEPAGLRAVDGLIHRLGTGVVPTPGDDVLDAGGLALVPGLVNGHTHAAMTLFRGYGDDLPLMEWLETRIWPAEAKLTPDDVYWGTRLAVGIGTDGAASNDSLDLLADMKVLALLQKHSTRDPAILPAAEAWQ